MQKMNGSGWRRPDWQLLLEIYVERHRSTHFAWGLHDCVQFALGWLELAREDLTPRDDMAAQLDYCTADDAGHLLGQHSLVDFVDAWGELPRIDPPFAQRGDLVLVRFNRRECLAVCVGGAAAGPGAAGLELAPMHLASAAWRV